MNNRIILSIIPIAVMLSGCSSNLVVSSINGFGPLSINSDNSIDVPFRVVVTNNGNSTAPAFKVSTSYKGNPVSPGSEFFIPFNVPGMGDVQYPMYRPSLAGGADAVFEGNLTLPASMRGLTATVTARADSCDGEEFMPDHCRVEESSEVDNKSTELTVILP